MKKTLTVIALVTTTLFSYAQKKISANISIGNASILAAQGNIKSYLNPIVKASVMARISQKTAIGIEVSNNWFKETYSIVTVKRKFVSVGLIAKTSLSNRIALVYGGGYMLNYKTGKAYIKATYKGVNSNQYYANAGVSFALTKNKKINPTLELLPIVYIRKSSVLFGVQTSLGLSF
jgi:hypothetical protein